MFSFEANEREAVVNHILILTNDLIEIFEKSEKYIFPYHRIKETISSIHKENFLSDSSFKNQLKHLENFSQSPTQSNLLPKKKICSQNNLHRFSV